MTVLHPISVSDAPKGLRLLMAACRPRTLGLAAAPVIVGAALGWRLSGVLDWPVLLATLAAALLIQAGTNLWNDLADGLRGADTPLRLGPPRVTAQGWAAPARVRGWALGAFGLAAVAGIFLAWRGGAPILGLGAASLVCGWAYSSGPRPISTTPLGEVFVVAFFGLGAVMGTAWLQALVPVPGALTAGIALGLPAAAVLMVNNHRDVDADRLAGRRTLAILLGARGALAVYAALMLTPFALLSLADEGGWLALVALPEALRLVHVFATTPRGRALNRLLGLTARCQMLMALSFVVGVAL